MSEILSIPRPEHPNPQFERENWQNLNGKWLFSIDGGVSGIARKMYEVTSAEKYESEILVPFCPESKLSGIENKDFMSAVWYKRTVEITEENLKGRVLLHFGAVDYETQVFVNGANVGNHFGGYTSFEFDITDNLIVGKNDITVFACDYVRSGKQPRGKQSQTYNSYGCDYTRTTGIWQTVWLEFVPTAHIVSAKYYPDIENSAFDIELTLSRPGTVKIEATYDGKIMGSTEKTTHGTVAFLHLDLSEKHLWELGNGRLYDLTLTLTSGDETDKVNSYAGLREVKLDGFKFLLNGKSVFQRTVLDQGFYPDGIYTAPTEDDLKKDIELSMSLGFNGARLHEKVFEARYLYHADKTGYMVWGEHANWGLELAGRDGYLGFEPEWLEAVSRDFNHPAIIGWCPFNEVWGEPHRKGVVDTIASVYKSTKLLDPTRPVIDVSGGYHVMYDIYDKHDYTQTPEVFKNKYCNFNGTKDSFDYKFKDKETFIKNKPFFFSEYGGIKWVPEFKQQSSEQNGWGYGNAPTSEEEFFARYEGLTVSLIDNPNIMGFCYTQLYDIEQEVNGLYTYDRKPKFNNYERIIAANRKKAQIED